MMRRLNFKISRAFPAAAMLGLVISVSSAVWAGNDPVKFSIDLGKTTGTRCVNHSDCGGGQGCFRHGQVSGICLAFSSAELAKDISVVRDTADGKEEILIQGEDPEEKKVRMIYTDDERFTAVYQEPDKKDLYPVEPVPSDPFSAPDGGLHGKNLPPEGRYADVFDNGHLRAEAFFRNGKLEGQYREYYPNGRLKLFEFYRNGLREGVVKDYYPNGKLHLECMFIGGVREGGCMLYHPDGAIYADLNVTNNPHPSEP